MKPAKQLAVLSILGIFGFIVLILWALAQESVMVGLEKMAVERWGIVTLYDLGVSLIIFSAYIFWRENSILRSIPWILGIWMLGNLTTLVYIAYVLISEGKRSSLLRQRS